MFLLHIRMILANSYNEDFILIMQAMGGIKIPIINTAGGGAALLIMREVWVRM